MQILFVYIYNEISSRPRRHTRRKRSMLCQNRPSLVRINIDSFVVLVSGKFPCFLEIDILFILNYKSGTKLAKIYPTGNEMFIPTYNKRTNSLVKNLRHCSNIFVEKRMPSYLSGRRINITLIFMSSSSYLVHAMSWRIILLKYRFL